MISNKLNSNFDMRIIATILIVVILLTAGCSAFRRRGVTVTPETPIPTSAKESLSTQVLSTNWLVSAAIIGIGLSLVGYVNGNKGALSVLVGSVAVLVLTLTVGRFAFWLAALGGLAVITGIGVFVYSLAINRGLWRPLVKK